MGSQIIDENLQAQEALHRQNQELAALHETTLALINQLDVGTVLETIVSRATALLGTPHGYLYVIEQDEAGVPGLVVRVGTGVFAEQKGFRTARGEGVAGRVWDMGQPLVVDDYLQWTGRIHYFDQIKLRSVFGLPLRSGQEILGVIGLAYMEPGRKFSQDQIDLLSRFGQMASLALQNAQLYEAARQELAERKKAEDALRESEGKLRAIVEYSNDALYIKDLEGRYLMINPAGAGLLGRSVEEITGQTDEFVFGPEGGREIAEIDRGILASGRPLSYERTRVIGGRRRTFFTTKFPYVSAQGDLLGTIGVTHDVTARKMAEEQIKRLNEDLEYRVADRTAQLQAANRDLQIEVAERKRAIKEIQFQALLLDQVQTAIAAAEPSGKVTYWNSQAESLYGWTAEEVTGMAMLDLPVWDEDRELTAHIADQLLRCGSWAGEFTPRRKDGTSFPAYGTVTLIHDEQGQALGVVGAAMDISDRKRVAEERERLHMQLEAEHTLLETIVGSAPVGIVLLDRQMRVMGLNAEYARLAGGSVASMRERSIYEVVPWARASRHLYERSLAGEAVDQDNFPYPHPDGETRYFDLRYRPVRDGSGEVSSLLGTVTDVTARYEIDQQKDEFIALASHELRTPLTSIKGFAKVGLRSAAQAGDERMLRTLTVINEQSDRLTRLINELLDVSRIQQGALPLHPARIDLGELFRHVIESLDLTAPEFKFSLNVPPALVVIEGDHQRVEEVLTNLIANAIKYSRDKHEIDITLAVAGNEAVTAVRDHGMGIPPEQQGRVFDRFYRGVNAGSNGRSGLGLGLFISRQIVERHGGRMWFESVHGEGSTFYFSLPLAARAIEES